MASSASGETPNACWAEIDDAGPGAGVPSMRLGPLTTVCDALLSVILAPSCAVCESLIDRPLGGPVCEACWNEVRGLAPPLCDACGEPLRTWRPRDVAEHRCPRCRRTRRLVRRAQALGAYDGALRSIIHAFKYEGRRSLGRRLSKTMRDQAGDLLEGADAVVPVPLHAARRRERGFNQAVDLASGLGRPVLHGLVRIRATAVQAELPEAQRHRNVRGAFAARRAVTAWRGAVVVLVDDVSTTGATLESCATALLDVGILEVRALTAARAVRRQP